MPPVDASNFRTPSSSARIAEATAMPRVS